MDLTRFLNQVSLTKVLLLVDMANKMELFLPSSSKQGKRYLTGRGRLPVFLTPTKMELQRLNSWLV